MNIIKELRDNNINVINSKKIQEGITVNNITINTPCNEPVSVIDLYSNAEYFTYVFPIMSGAEQYRLKYCSLFLSHYLNDIENVDVKKLPIGFYQFDDPFCDWDIIFDTNETEENLITNDENGDIVIEEINLITPENITGVQLVIEEELIDNSLTKDLLTYFEYIQVGGRIWVTIPLELIHSLSFET